MNRQYQSMDSTALAGRQFDDDFEAFNRIKKKPVNENVQDIVPEGGDEESPQNDEEKSAGERLFELFNTEKSVGYSIALPKIKLPGGLSMECKGGVSIKETGEEHNGIGQGAALGTKKDDEGNWMTELKVNLESGLKTSFGTSPLHKDWESDAAKYDIGFDWALEGPAASFDAKDFELNLAALKVKVYGTIEVKGTGQVYEVFLDGEIKGGDLARFGNDQLQKFAYRRAIKSLADTKTVSEGVGLLSKAMFEKEMQLAESQLKNLDKTIDDDVLKLFKEGSKEEIEDWLKKAGIKGQNASKAAENIVKQQSKLKKVTKLADLSKELIKLKTYIGESRATKILSYRDKLKNKAAEKINKKITQLKGTVQYLKSKKGVRMVEKAVAWGKRGKKTVGQVVEKVLKSSLAKKMGIKLAGKLARHLLKFIPFVNVIMILWDLYDLAKLLWALWNGAELTMGDGGTGDPGESSAEGGSEGSQSEGTTSGTSSGEGSSESGYDGEQGSQDAPENSPSGELADESETYIIEDQREVEDDHEDAINEYSPELDTIKENKEVEYPDVIASDPELRERFDLMTIEEQELYRALHNWEQKTGNSITEDQVRRFFEIVEEYSEETGKPLNMSQVDRVRQILMVRQLTEKSDSLVSVLDNLEKLLRMSEKTDNAHYEQLIAQQEELERQKMNEEFDANFDPNASNTLETVTVFAEGEASHTDGSIDPESTMQTDAEPTIDDIKHYRPATEVSHASENKELGEEVKTKLAAHVVADMPEGLEPVSHFERSVYQPYSKPKPNGRMDLMYFGYHADTGKEVMVYNIKSIYRGLEEHGGAMMHKFEISEPTMFPYEYQGKGRYYYFTGGADKAIYISQEQWDIHFNNALKNR